ncbi:MAG: insulinase family protein [Proteobacteria bacterium]|nr:insulinase family protein [Pseudomonadota bacterium]
MSRAALVALCLGASTMVQAADPLPYEVHERTLENGMRVVAVQTPSPGVVAYRTWMSVGSRDETSKGQTGFAHFFEHLMFHGTETRPRGTREQALVQIGAEDNAWTWFDETVYNTLLPSAELDPFLAIEADRFKALALTADGVQREAGAVYGEFRKGQSDPGERLTDTLYATAFTTHTYTHSTIGYEADVAAMPSGFDAAQQFFAAHYRPENAVLLLVGDVEADAAFTLAQTHFGDWEGAEAEEGPPIEQEPPQEETRRVHVPWSGPTTPRLAMAWKVPAHEPASADLALLELIASHLGATSGPLHARLVREEGLALRVRVHRDDFVDTGLFRIEVTVHEATDLDAVEAIVLEELEALSALPAATLEEVRKHVVYSQRLTLEHPAKLANALGWQMRRGDDAQSLSTWMHTLQTTDASRAAAVVEAIFSPETLTVVTLATEEAK